MLKIYIERDGLTAVPLFLCFSGQRRNAVSHKVLCQAFFQESGGYSTVFSDSTMSSFLSFRWAPRFTSRENTVVSTTAHR